MTEVSNIEDWRSQPYFRLEEAAEEIRPFSCRVDDAAIEDLRNRLTRVRWPDAGVFGDWTQGPPLARAEGLVTYWRDSYDWRAFEQRINGWPQFRTKIDGLGVHFFHVKSKHVGAVPVILTHGWPGSFIEYINVIDRLTDPTKFGGSADDAFHVVVPSLPGFGFSDRPSERGWGPPRIADAWATLMARLGYSRWFAHGNDIGAAVSVILARTEPPGLVAAHTGFQLTEPDELPANPTAEEAQAIAHLKNFWIHDSGYFKQQSTKPQTLGYALADSPVGQAMWLYEKYRTWSDNDGDPEDAFTIDQMLDMISLYWYTDTGASAARIYHELVGEDPESFRFNAGPVPRTPMATTRYRGDLLPAPRSWAEAVWPNLYYWSEAPRGAHWRAWEDPDWFAQDLRDAFRPLRSAPPVADTT